MKKKNLWIDLSLFNLCVVALLGFILRSKILFSLPGINYLFLLDAHFHFAFQGWITLSLLVLLVNEILPGSLSSKPVYGWLFGALILFSFAILICTSLDNTSMLRDLFSYSFILITYFFSWVFLNDIRKSTTNKVALLLSVCAIILLLLSSLGPILSTYLHAVRSHDPFLYRDAQYIYLHLQYNGFFTLAVFALLFHKLLTKISKRSQQAFFGFSVLLCISVIPSLFLSFLWQDPNDLFRFIALTGSILTFATSLWFIISALPLLEHSKMIMPSVRYIFFLSFTAFILKMFLQSLTIFTPIGNAVFGDRPVIIGFLHLVLLGFVSLFILAYYAKKHILNIKLTITLYALYVFIICIILNEIVLMLQGVGAMILKSSPVFPWLLWSISICLLIGTILIFAARMRSKKVFPIQV